MKFYTCVKDKISYYKKNNVYTEMKEAGLPTYEIVAEIVGAVCVVFVIPISLMFIISAFA